MAVAELAAADPTPRRLFRHSLSSGLAPVRHVLDDLQAALVSAGAPPQVSESALIILAEVLNNVVEHAYLFEEGHPIDLAVWLRADGIWCDIRDEGGPMPGHAVPDGRFPLIDRSRTESLPEGGFGWAMVHHLTRDLRYVRTRGRNHLEFLVPA